MCDGTRKVAQSNLDRHCLQHRRPELYREAPQLCELVRGVCHLMVEALLQCHWQVALRVDEPCHSPLEPLLAACLPVHWLLLLHHAANSTAMGESNNHSSSTDTYSNSNSISNNSSRRHCARNDNNDSDTNADSSTAFQLRLH